MTLNITVNGAAIVSLRSKTLSYYVNLQKRKMLKLRKIQRFEQFIKQRIIKIQRFFTSNWSIIPIIGFFIMFFFFPVDGLIYSQFPTISEWNIDYYFTLWQVYGAIVGLSFVAIFFSYEAFFGRVASEFKNLESRFRIEFYKKTLIMPFLFFNLFSLIYVGFVIHIPSNLFQSITLLVVSILSICLIFSKTASFFEGEAIEKTRLKILNSEIISSIDTEVNRRLALNLLLKLDEKSDFVKYDLLSIDNQNRIPVGLNVSERKRIRDIAIDKIIKNMQSANCTFFLKKGIGDLVSKKYSVVGSVPKTTEEEIVKNLKKSFKVITEPTRKDIHLAFDDLEEQILKVINRGSSRDLARFLEIYYNTIENFLDTLQSYGIKYNSQQAKQVDVLHEWEPIFRIQDDFFNLIEISIKSGNREIIRSTVDFVEDLLDLSKEKEDFLIFYRFKNFWVNIFSCALELSDESLREFTINKVLSKINYFIQTHLLLRITYMEPNKKLVENYREYIINLILLFENLLKITLDKNDLKIFKTISKILSGIKGFYDPENRRPLLVELETKLQYAELDSEEKKRLEEEIIIIKDKIQIKHDIEIIIPEIWLGIGGWITELYSQKKVDSNQALYFLQVVLTQFKNLKKVTSEYNGIDRLSSFYQHSWNWWKFEDKPNAVTISFGSEDWITRFYCIVGIILTPNKINKPDSLELSSNSENNLALIKRQCQNLKDNYATWSDIFAIDSKEFSIKLKNFIQLHEKSVEEQKVVESKKLIEQPLDKDKIEEFKKQITNSWRSNSEIRGIIQKFGNYHEKESLPEKIPPFGIRKFFPKDAFVSNGTIIVGVEQFGQNIGRRENTFISSKILDVCIKKDLVNEDELIEKILSTIELMEKRGFTTNAILTESWKFIRVLQKTKTFKPKWNNDIVDVGLKGFEGYLKEIPVFLMSGLAKNTIYIIDFKKIGTLTQFKVHKDDKTILHFDVQFIDEKKAKEYLKENPKLGESNGKKLSKKDATNNLQKFVFIKILERFGIKIDANQACIALQMTSDIK